MGFVTIGARAWSSLALSLLFAWHPLRVESVAWVSERKDLLSAFFGLLTIIGYLWYVRRPSSWSRYSAVIACFAAGLMAKPMVITLPFVLLLLDYWPLNRLKWDRLVPPVSEEWPLIREKLPLFALIVGSASITYLAQLRGGSVVSENLSLITRASNAVNSYFVYIRQTIVPVDLGVFYPFPEDSVPTAKTLLAISGLVAITFVSVWQRKRLPYFPVGWFWYLGTLVPVIGLVQVGGQAHADRYTYIPTIGVAITLLGLCALLTDRWPRSAKLLCLVVLLALAALAFGSRQQMQHWRSSEALFARATQVSPHSGLAWSNLGAALSAQSRALETVTAYSRAVELLPTLDSQAGLATALAATGDTASAIQLFRQLIKDHPDDYKLANNLAWILATATDDKLRDSAEAVRLAELAVKNSGGAMPTASSPHSP